MYENGDLEVQDISKALFWYEKAAERGDSDALINMALIYRNGDRVPVDQKRAFLLYERSAKMNNPKGMFDLGTMYHFGHGTSVDIHKALDWYEAAARGNEGDAMYNMGLLYLSGTKDLPVDEQLALTWLLRAWESHRLKDAAFLIGQIYDLGKAGLEQSRETAQMWYRRSGRDDKGQPIE